MREIINCEKLNCPQPVINTKKYFDSIAEGEAQVIVDNEVAKNNICKFAASNGLSCVAEEKDSLFLLNLTKVLKPESKASATETSCKEDRKKSFTLLVSTNILGGGDDRLGTTLMKSYFYALSESDNIPNTILFLNGGVKLTSQGTDILDSLNTLKSKGAEILSCGTCLDFYDLKDKLLIGEITNMFTIVEKMNNADLTIKL